ncbi:MAG: oxidoreductase [Burkholderiales bacterium]|nr:oxidoreductase [Burkholderiales bacterium]
MASPSTRTTLRLQVVQRAQVARDIVEFTLVSPDGAALPAFEPGAHIGVLTPANLWRKYSLVNPPGVVDRYQIAVRREGNGRGGSLSMVDGLTVGALVEIEAPQNAFPLAAAAKRFLFFAGGIGITPILCMVRHLRQRAADGDANAGFRLVYLTRSAEDTAYADELAAPDAGGQVTVHHDHGRPEDAYDLWPLLERPAAGTHVYCCGPRGLMDAVRDMTGHWPDTSIHFESFGTGDAALFAPNQPFTIRLARSGETIAVDADQSALEALRAHGVRVQSSCEAGSCGSCRTTYLSGNVEHRDLVLGEDEKADQIMVCVSRARGGVLELDL